MLAAVRAGGGYDALKACVVGWVGRPRCDTATRPGCRPHPAASDLCRAVFDGATTPAVAASPALNRPNHRPGRWPVARGRARRFVPTLCCQPGARPACGDSDNPPRVAVTSTLTCEAVLLFRARIVAVVVGRTLPALFKPVHNHRQFGHVLEQVRPPAPPLLARLGQTQPISPALFQDRQHPLDPTRFRSSRHFCVVAAAIPFRTLSRPLLRDWTRSPPRMHGVGLPMQVFRYRLNL